MAEGIRFPPRANVEKLVVSRAIEPLAREQYKKLAAALHQAQLERPVKVVMLTSALPGEGKTLTAANLALTLAESYRRHVLLVDADLRRPMIHEVFGVSNARGLNDSLADEGPLPLIQASPRLSLLTAGPGGGDPMATLTSERMRALIEEARAAFDWVLLDTPPVALLSDAKLLASMTDGAVLVALAGKTAYDVIQPAIEVFGQDRVVGVVLNRATAAALPYPYQRYYDDYYDPPVR